MTYFIGDISPPASCPKCNGVGFLTLQDGTKLQRVMLGGHRSCYVRRDGINPVIYKVGLPLDNEMRAWDELPQTMTQYLPELYGGGTVCGGAHEWVAMRFIVSAKTTEVAKDDAANQLQQLTDKRMHWDMYRGNIVIEAVTNKVYLVDGVIT